MLQNPIFQVLNDTQARLIWNDIKAGVQRAIDGTPGNEIKDIERYVMTATARVIVIKDDDNKRFGSVIYMPIGDMAFIVSIEGYDMVNIDNGRCFHDYMKTLGFKNTNCLAAPVQARLWKRLGYKPVKTLLEKDIWAE
jgi:hypothetical protein